MGTGRSRSPGRQAVKGCAVIQYRTFRNGDPPILVQLWNQCFTNRGATILRGTMLIEYFLFAKPYFDPAGLVLAFDGTQAVGFAHAAFGPSADRSAIDRATGVLCTLGVIPERRRQGIGGELLRRSEEYLRSCGAKCLFAGPMAPCNPFTFAIYGGCDSPGFLDSDAAARPFFEKHGYGVQETTVVAHRKLDQPLALVDARFAAYRQRYEIQVRPLPVSTWWQECVLGPVGELMYEYLLVDKSVSVPAARVVLWEMETFRPRWDDHAVGVVGLEIRPELRRQGLGKFLMGRVLHHLQEQYYTLVEMQYTQGNAAAGALANQLGFSTVDAGHRFIRL
jgi:GNAT superfamily N-acetyltransferase